MKRQDLLNALELVKPGLANREIIQQSTSFAFMNGRVVTYNDEISISHPIKELDIEGIVQADELYKFLSKTKAEEIVAETKDNEIQITAGKAKVGLILNQEIALPLEEIGKKSKWKTLPDDFMDAVKFTLFSCSKDMSRPKLTCLNIRKDGIIESSDGYRLTQFQISVIPIPAFLLPGTSAQELIKYDMNKIAHGEGWIHFKNDFDTVFSCRIFDESFPDTKKLIEVKGTQIQFPKSMQRILERAMVFAKRDHFLNESINIEIVKKKITIKAKSASGWFEESANIRYRGESITVSVNPAFLKDILDRLRTCILGECRAKFEGNNWVHVALVKDE